MWRKRENIRITPNLGLEQLEEWSCFSLSEWLNEVQNRRVSNWKHTWKDLKIEGDPLWLNYIQFSSVIQSCPTHRLQHARLPCPSPTPGACSNSCPSSRWCHPNISSSVVPFSSCLQSFPASGSFLMSWLFASGGQSIGDSASVLTMNIQDWFPLGLTGLISLLSKGRSRVFSNTKVQKHRFFGTQLSLWSNSHIHTWLLEKP